MAEEGVGRARQDRCKIVTLRGEVRVAYGIDAAIETVQAAGGHRAGDCVCRIAERTEQLADGYDAVLAIRQLSKVHLEGAVVFSVA